MPVSIEARVMSEAAVLMVQFLMGMFWCEVVDKFKVQATIAT